VIYEAGPMTNLALAVRLDPQFAPLAKELVFMGGYAAQTSSVKGFRVDDFNILFDPEAAQITLGAGWARITSVADATDPAVLTPGDIQRLRAQPTRASAYLLRNSDCKYPLWDETGGLVIADPTLITRSEPMYMRAVTEFGPQYGGVVLTPLAAGTVQSGAVVTVVEAIDVRRTMDAYVAAMTAARFR
jgi:inosine-uridine nucleoside N-ribohydrolase